MIYEGFYDPDDEVLPSIHEFLDCMGEGFEASAFIPLSDVELNEEDNLYSDGPNALTFTLGLTYVPPRVGNYPQHLLFSGHTFDRLHLTKCCATKFYATKTSPKQGVTESHFELNTYYFDLVKLS